MGGRPRQAASVRTDSRWLLVREPEPEVGQGKARHENSRSLKAVPPSTPDPAGAPTSARESASASKSVGSLLKRHPALEVCGSERPSRHRLLRTATTTSTAARTCP